PAQIACFLLLIVALLIALERMGRHRGEFAISAQDVRHSSRITLAGPARWIATVVCFLPVLLGFLLPAGYLLREVVARGVLVGFDASLFDTSLARHALTTVWLAATATATAFTLVLGFLAVAALRH